MVRRSVQEQRLISMPYLRPAWYPWVESYWWRCCTDNKRAIVELNSSSAIIVCIPRESLSSSVAIEKRGFGSPSTMIANWPLRLSPSNLEKTKRLEINAVRFRALSLPLLLCYSALRTDLSLPLKISRSSLHAFLCCFFRAISSWRMFFIWISLWYLLLGSFFCLTATWPNLSDAKIVIMVVKALNVFSSPSLDDACSISHTSSPNLCHSSMLFAGGHFICCFVILSMHWETDTWRDCALGVKPDHTPPASHQVEVLCSVIDSHSPDI